MANLNLFRFPTGMVRLLRYFSWQPQTEADFSRGIVRDLPRSSIPPGGLYDAVDFLVDKPGMLRKRGGTSYQSSALGATKSGVNFVASAEYPTGVKVMGLGADGHLYDATAGATVDAGAFGITTLDTPKLYVDKLVVASADGVTAPKKVTVVAGVLTAAALGGSPPPGRLAAVHLSRIALANSAANPNRAWFSPVPNVESAWDTANAYVDFNHSLAAVAPVQGVMLGFSAGATERLIGNIPPGTTGENMSLQTIGAVGCADARSVAPWGANIVFASQEGVYVTNGGGFDSLTEKADGTGILSYWRKQYATVADNAGFIAGGIINKNYYLLTLGYGTTIVDTLICYLPRKAWTRTANIGCLMYAPRDSGGDELYGAQMSNITDGNRIVKFSNLLPDASGSTTGQDANQLPVQPSCEFRMIGEGTGLKVYGDGHLTYNLRAASTGPQATLAVSVAAGLQAGAAYAAVPESPLPATNTDDGRRTRLTVSKDAQAVHVKLAQTGGSYKTEVYLLEVDQRAYDSSAEVPPA